MKLSYVDLLGDRERHEVDATVTTDHPASSYGMPVVVLANGEAIGALSWQILFYRVERATPEELADLCLALSSYAEPYLADDALKTNLEPGRVFINVWNCHATVARYDRTEAYVTTWSPAANADALAELARAAVEDQGGAINLSGHYYCPPALAALAVWNEDATVA